jgi:hypothetical protein
MRAVVNTGAGQHSKTSLGRAIPSIVQTGVIGAQLTALCSKALRLWYIASSAFRSFRGHLRNHNAKEYPSVDFGPAFQRLGDGSLQPDDRTNARSVGIDTLSAKYPWIDTVDCRIFLSGFDEGERYSRRTHDSGNESGKHAGA